MPQGQEVYDNIADGARSSTEDEIHENMTGTSCFGVSI
jgi:hypothetical protein